MRKSALYGAALLVAFVLGGCGSTAEERGISGAGIGAAGGAVLGAVTGLSLVQGVLIGAAAGGLTGALTDEDTVDLGDPIWKSSDASDDGTGPSRPRAASTVTQDIQRGLAGLGYTPGPADGINGPRTQAAIRAYQADHGLLTDGRPSIELASHIEAQGGT